MSDLPVWIGAGGSVVQGLSATVQLFLGVRAAREEAANEFGRLLDELLDMPAEEIAELLGRPKLAEIVGSAWEAAARTASADKRWILAKVVAAALRDPNDAVIDPVPLLLRCRRP